MNISCDIIKDLLPLYHDDVCSEDSKIAIEEHLQSCIECQRYFDSINEEVFQNNVDTNVEEVKAKSLRLLKKKITKKNVIISIISIVCATIIFIGTSFIIFHKQIPIEYEDGLISVNMSYDGVIDIILNKDDYYCSYVSSKLIEKDSSEENIAYIYYTDSIWTKYLSKKKTDEPHQMSIGNNIVTAYDDNGNDIDYKEEFTAVYYLVGDYTKIGQMSDEEFSKAAQDAVLLWER